MTRLPICRTASRSRDILHGCCGGPMWRRELRGALPRPRSFQGSQRRVRPYGRRCAAARGCSAAARCGSGRFPGALRRRRVYVCDALRSATGTAVALADRLHAAFAEEFEVEGHQVRTGLSIGVAIFGSDGDDETTLLSNADAALYRSKADGRGRTRFFEIGNGSAAARTPRHPERFAHRHRAARTQRALPAAGAIEGEIVGMEALCRWTHPTRGAVSPAEFIPLAEESGMIMQIGEWMLREACREAASWTNPLQHCRQSVADPVPARRSGRPCSCGSAETGLQPSPT